MKKLSFAIAVVIALTGSAYAGPKDKNQLALVNPDSLGGSAPWDNTAVDAKSKYSKCKQQVQLKAGTAAGLLGMDLVCISSGDTYTSLAINGGNSLVLRSTVDAVKGKMKMKADLRAIGCGVTATATTINSDMVCYQDTGWDAATECGSAGGVWITPNTQPGTEGFKPGDLVGLCQGFSFGFRLTAPAGQLLAQVGVYSPN